MFNTEFVSIFEWKHFRSNRIVLCIVHMHCEPVSVVSEWVCVGVCVYVQLCFRAHMYYVLCKCMYNVCVCMWVDVWTHALYQGSFCSLKSQWASVDAEPAGNHGNTSLPWLCHSNVQSWQAVWILGKIREWSFKRSGHGVNHKRHEGDKHLSGR